MRAITNIFRGIKARVGFKKIVVYFLNDIKAYKQVEILIKKGWLR